MTGIDELGNARFAVLTYRHNLTTEMHLNEHDDIDEIKDAINNLEYIAGSTATGPAIKEAHEVMFSVRHKHRPFFYV